MPILASEVLLCEKNQKQNMTPVSIEPLAQVFKYSMLPLP